jgi:hypothetical protein
MQEIKIPRTKKPWSQNLWWNIERMEFARVSKCKPNFSLFNWFPGVCYWGQARLRFHNTGPGSIPGVIIYSIEDGTEGKPGLMHLDFKYRFHTQTLPVNVQNSRKLLIHVQKIYTSIWVHNLWVGVFKFIVV